MAGDAEELPPLVQELVARYDPRLSQPGFERMGRDQQDAVRDMNKSLERIAKSAAMRQARLLSEQMRKQNEVIRRAGQERERLALTAGKREGEIVKATSREVVAARRKGNTQELEVQRKGTSALVDNQRKGMARWEETVKRSYFRMKGAYQKANQGQQQEQQRSNRERQQDQQRANRQSQAQQDRAFKVWFAAFDDYLKRRRAREREEGFDRLAAQKAADRRQWQQQKSTDSLMLAEQKAMLRQQVIDHQASAAKTVNAHKAMWSIIRTTTETGGRFMSSITQSFLRSMGTGIARGLGHITSIFRREGNEQEAALRSTYAQQEQITRRALVRQQGIVQGFQTRNAAVTQGGAGGGPVGAIMSIRNMLLGAGAVISARAIFGPIMDYQQTKIAFEGILQSGTAAQAMLDDLQEFAKDTPFTFQGISESARSLLAVGYAAEDVIPMMTTLGNATAGLGLGEDAISGVIRALGQMKGKGKASAEELQQISEQMPGFSAIGAIAESMGISTADAFDLMGQGAIPADVAIEAILDGMERMPGAAGAMQRQSESLAGRLSTLKDTIEILLIDAMKPFIGAISDGVGVFTTFLDNLFNAGGVFKVARSAILGLAIALGSMLAFQGVVLMLDGIKLALAAIAANPAVVVFTGLVVAMTMLYRHVPRVTKVVDDMREAFGEFFSGTREALGLLMDGDFPAFFDRMQSLGTDLMDALAPSVNVIRDFFMEAFNTASDWVRGGGMGDLWDTITETISTTADQIANSPAAEWLVRFGKKSWRKWQQWLDSGGLGDLADSLADKVTGAIDAVKERLDGIDWEQLLGPAMAAAALVIAGLVLGWPVAIGAALVAGVIALSPRLRDGLSELFGQAQTWISDAFGSIDWMAVGMTVMEGLRRVGEFIGGPLIGAIFSETGLKIIGAIALGIVAGFGALMLGFFQGLSQSSPKINEAVGNILDDLVDKLRDWVRGLDGIAGAIVQTVIGPFEFMFGVIADGFDFLGEVLEGWRTIVTGIFAGDWGQVFEGFKHVWWAVFQFLIDIVSRFLTWASDSFSRLGSTLWGAAVGGLSWLKDQFFQWAGDVITFWTALPQTMANAFLSFGGMMIDAIKAGFDAGGSFAVGIVNGIIDFINTSVLDRISNLEIDLPFGRSFGVPDLPHIPRLAKGGLVTQPTVALIGEAGPELIIPLDDKQRAIEVLAAAQLPSGWGIQPDVPGLAQAIASTAAAIAPIGEAIQTATAPGMEGWFNSIDDLLERIDVRFRTWGFGMISLAGTIATAIVTALTTTLREGSREVATITRNYSRKLVDALNPLLTGIGEPAINLQFSERGNINTPRIAAPGDGPQVHVFNEGQAGRYGEAYIPFQPSNRGRSRSIADQAVRRLGGSVQWFEQGGITSQVPAGATLPGVSGDIGGLVTEFARRLSVWSLAHGGGYHVGSGYRSYARQAQLYADYLAGRHPAPVAPPGTSMHNFGLASDGNRWGHLNPEAFGLRYPMSYEPWHVEPVEGKGLLNGDTFPMFQPLPQPPDAGERGILSVVASKAMQYTYDKVLAAASAFSMPGVSIGLGSTGATPEIMAAIRQAMSIVGVPDSWLGPLLTLISRESSFNPRAYNGELGASGLMQTIPSTFAAYHLDPWNYIFGPLDNVIAGLRYILSRYGSIFNVGQAVSPTPTRGYSYGGVVDRDGMYRLAEGNRSEVVLPLENRGRLMELLRRTGLADTIAMAAGLDVTSSPAAANSTSTTGAVTGPTIENVIGEMHVNTRAEDPNTVALLTASKVDRDLRLALSGF